LTEIKAKHEEWIASLGEDTEPDPDPGPVRLIPDPTRPQEKMLKFMITGSKLWNFIDGAYAFYPSWPDGLSDEHEDLIAALFDNVRDWIDISGDLSFSEKRNAGRSLNTNIEELVEAGFVVGARNRFLLLAGGVNKEPQPWRTVDIEVQPFSAMQLVDTEGKPVTFEEIRSRAGVNLSE